MNKLKLQIRQFTVVTSEFDRLIASILPAQTLTTDAPPDAKRLQQLTWLAIAKIESLLAEALARDEVEIAVHEAAAVCNDC